jgi:hypothetical protein
MVKLNESGPEASRSTVSSLPTARTPVLAADQGRAPQPTHTCHSPQANDQGRAPQPTHTCHSPQARAWMSWRAAETASAGLAGRVVCGRGTWLVAADAGAVRLWRAHCGVGCPGVTAVAPGGAPARARRGMDRVRDRVDLGRSGRGTSAESGREARPADGHRAQRPRVGVPLVGMARTRLPGPAVA